MVCLDSDIIIDFLKEKEYAIKKIKDLQEKELKLSTTTINTFELFRGVIKSKSSEAIDPLIKFLSNISIYNFNLESSKKAAEIFENLIANGEIIDLADIMIAATVILNNEPLLTKNIKHFKRIPELKIESI